MRFEGVLSAWDHSAGYGAIRPSGGGEEVFVSLAAFPTDGEGPRPDELLSFEIVTGRDGRKQAVNLRRLSHRQISPALREASVAGGARARARQLRRRRRLAAVAGSVLVVLALVGWGVQTWAARHKGVEVSAAQRH